MLGLLITAGVLVACAAVVLALCARAPRADDPAAHLSRLDHLDGLRDHTATPSRTHTQAAEPERVA